MIFKPTTAKDVARLIADASLPFEVIGTATKRAIGRPSQNLNRLDLSEFSTVNVYEPEELILDIGAGAKIKDVEKLISSKNQYLAFEPPDYSMLLGSRHSGTIGSVLACNISGPRRLKAGAARDHILGLQGVSGRGEIFKAGARVVKNVTGYDVPKLMAGSYGTLAVFTSVIFKVLPKPETEETLRVAGLDDHAAVQAMSKAMQSSAEVSGAAHIPGNGTFLRLEGIAPSVASRRDKLINLLGGRITVLAAEESSAQWRAIRDVLPLADNLTRMVWKISVPPSASSAIIAKLKAQIDLRYFFDWAGGLIWLDCAGEYSHIIRTAIGDGHALLIRAPDDVRMQCEVFHPQPRSLAALSARIKNSFDPKGLLNPGRMYKGV
jgi:glycolate oxidase FAD binding subunit